MAATSAAKKSRPASMPPGSMPIEDYDRRSIKEILPLLKAFSSQDLKTVTAYEKAGKNRVTLLRGIRKVELDREAAASKRPAKARLAVVEEAVAAVETVSEPAVAVAKAPKAPKTARVAKVAKVAEVDDINATFDLDDFDDFDDLDEINEIDAIDAMGAVDDPMDDGRAMDDVDLIDEEIDPVEAVSDVAEVSEAGRATVKATSPKKRRSRPPVKAATWEEELRPQLPKRFQSSAFDDIDPPVIAMEQSSPALIPTPDAAPISSKTAKALSFRPRITKRIENAAIVMAAILAVLLGLAIGTVLARSGSSDASQAPTSVVVEAANVPAAG